MIQFEFTMNFQRNNFGKKEAEFVTRFCVAQPPAFLKFDVARMIKFDPLIGGIAFCAL